MSIRGRIAAVIAAALLLTAATAAAQTTLAVPPNTGSSPAASPPAAAVPAPPAATSVPPLGELKPLGRDRYQIGRIVVDKRARKFTVPGRVHLLQQPLEYLATAPGGKKEYESLLELAASGSELNLACILLGLERDSQLAQFYQFSQTPLSGPRVTLSIAWTDGRKRRQVTAAEALFEPQVGVPQVEVEWVYTGSHSSLPNGQFAADATGTLIGFVHDPNSIIESVQGLGMGAYGSVSGNTKVLPPVGTPIELIVEVPLKSPNAR